MVFTRQSDAIAIAALSHQCEQQAEQRRKIFLDVRRDHAAKRCARLHVLDALVESRQRDDGLDLRIDERAFELMLGVDRVERATKNCGQFGSSSATRSPRLTPSAINAAAQASLERSSWPYVTVAPLNRSAGA